MLQRDEIEQSPGLLAHGEDLERILITEEEIQERVAELGRQISEEYRGKDLVLVSILKGGIVLLADLSRQISIPHQFDMVGAQSYKGGTRPVQEVSITKDVDFPVEGKHLIVVEDIYDTGNTLYVIHKMLQNHEPASLEVCALLSKRKKHNREMHVKYVGFEIDDVFVVGYGLDFQERFRNLNCIGVLKPSVYQ